MFKITLSPKLSNGSLTLAKSGLNLTINDSTYDFSPLNDGDEIPVEAVRDDHIVGNITKSDGVISLTVIMPYENSGAPSHIRSPEPIILDNDREITFNEKVAADD